MTISRPRNRLPRRHALAMLVPSLLGASALSAAASEADEVEFEQNFFVGTSADFSRFSKANAIAPGVYPLDVYVNEQLIGRHNISFRDDGGVVAPCLDGSLLSKSGWAIDKVRAAASAAGYDYQAGRSVCGSLDQLVPGATQVYDGPEQRLNITIPQSLMNRQPRGHVDESRLTHGVASAFLGYQTTVNSEDSGKDRNWHAYTTLRGGVNVGGWHLRHSGAFQYRSETGGGYRSQSTAVQRDVPAVRGQLTLGQSYTDGRHFDSIRIIGAKLASDDRMLPASQAGYAPTVRGSAASNASVVIRQRGQVIYQANVAPGPFEIDDLYDTGYAGDLEVTVTETGGTSSTFTVPFASTANVLREGAQRFSVSAGRVDESALADDQWILQGTYQRGISSKLTAYGGVSVLQNYLAGQAGVGLNTSFGALAADVTFSRHTPTGGPDKTGRSVQVRYSKNIPNTGTSFAVAAYRYNSGGYVGLQDLVRHSSAHPFNGPFGGNQLKQRFDVTMNQMVGNRGALYLTGSRSQYRGHVDASTSLTAGLNFNWRRATVGANVRKSLVSQLSGESRAETFYQLSVSVPLGQGSRRAVASIRADHGDGREAVQVGLNGSRGEFSQLSYGASASVRPSKSFNADASYRHSRGEVMAGFSSSAGRTSTSLGMAGGFVLHRGGITVAPSVGDTMALVHAPGAAGALIAGSQGAKVDRRGFAVVPSLSAYRMNNVSLDSGSMSLDADLDSSSEEVAPRTNALALVQFKTTQGTAVLITTETESKEGLPFGATVHDASGAEVGIVGQGGAIYARLKATRGAPLTVRWGDAQSCELPVNLEKGTKAAPGGFMTLQATCRPQLRIGLRP